MAQPGSKVGRLLHRVRRRVALWVAPELDLELKKTKRKLRGARRKLRAARADLHKARQTSSVPADALPEAVNETIRAVTRQKPSS